MFNFTTHEEILLRESISSIIAGLLITFLYNGTLLSDIGLFCARFCIVVTCMNIIFYLFVGSLEENEEQNKE